MVEVWHLRPELEFKHHVDSWNVRSQPDFDAPVVHVLLPGHLFSVLGREGEWLKVQDDGITSNAWAGWSYQKHEQDDALVPVAGAKPLDLCREPSSPTSRRRSCSQHAAGLIEVLTERRRTLEQALSEKDWEGMGKQEIVRKAAAVEETMAQLEMLGFKRDQLLVKDDELVKALRVDLTRHNSYLHSDFDNPGKDSCWLSTFFQSLWHSRVFHALFDHLIRPLPAHASGQVANALRETWGMYERAASKGESVPVRSLVHAWGEGYGDCAEAFGNLQADGALGPLANQLALVSVPFAGNQTTPEHLWKCVEEAGLADMPLLVLDMTLPPVCPSAAILTLALGLVPRGGRRGELAAELGREHRLVAMVCYLDEFEHYVVFCRRQSDPSQWLLFNDLPGIVSGVRRELQGWAAVAHECARMELRPRVLLYENPAGATRVLASASPDLVASIHAAAASPVQEENRDGAGSGLLRGKVATKGMLAVVLVFAVALIVQQALEIRTLMTK